MTRWMSFAGLACLVLMGSLPAVDGAVHEPNLVYASPDGTELQLDFVRPEGKGPYPLVVLIHGGGWRAGSRTEYKELQRHLAGLGMASASVQYRFTPAHQFPAQLNDVQAAIGYLATHTETTHIDPQRVGLMGASAGGHLALLAGLQGAPESVFKTDQPAEQKPIYTVRAIINVCGPTNLKSFQSTPTGDAQLKRYTSRDSSELLADLLGTTDRAAEVYATASPISHVREGVPAVLTLHGTKDDLVPVAQAEELHAALRNVRAKEQLIRVEGGGHDFGKWPEAERNVSILAMMAFLQQNLGATPAQ